MLRSKREHTGTTGVKGRDMCGNKGVKRAKEMKDTEVRSLSEDFAEEEEELPQLETRLAVGDSSVLTPQLDDRTLTRMVVFVLSSGTATRDATAPSTSSCCLTLLSILLIKSSAFKEKILDIPSFVFSFVLFF